MRRMTATTAERGRRRFIPTSKTFRTLIDRIANPRLPRLSSVPGQQERDVDCRKKRRRAFAASVARGAERGLSLRLTAGLQRDPTKGTLCAAYRPVDYPFVRGAMHPSQGKRGAYGRFGAVMPALGAGWEVVFPRPARRCPPSRSVGGDHPRSRVRAGDSSSFLVSRLRTSRCQASKDPRDVPTCHSIDPGAGNRDGLVRAARQCVIGPGRS